MSDTLAPERETRPAPPPQEPRRRRINLGNVLVEGRALVALAIIVVIFASLSPNYLQPDNLILMTRHVAMNAILAIGMLMVILNGGIDLSVGSTVGLSGVIAGYLLQGWDMPITQLVAYPPVWVVIIGAVALGALVGYVNGLLVSKLNVAPFIATLGMLYVARGIALLITNGETFTALQGEEGLGNTGFVTFLASAPLGIPMPVWFMVVFAVGFSLLLNRTAFGRWLYATGGNERAAELSGVPVKKVQTLVYVMSGFCAATVGLLLTADLPAATPRAGEFYELNAIAAVVIGGAALSGGRGTIRGTLIGAFVIGFLVDGLVLVGVSVFWQQVIKGAVIILAVAVDQLQQSFQKRRALRKVAASTNRPGSPSPA
ncbi:ABC transporter permease [Phycicoccus sp. BSK3Z-2]|uniref:ABC transporter permease n=1 Tax=Phycicoccus avicenniae TaxID=2828860 RepID=A0A941I167_9MICO|nr:ABC transporter permease [Phycicoccus avicenniae]MBR7744620.1 ABC transporter permease [Phycicoccus avicenniae]